MRFNYLQWVAEDCVANFVFQTSWFDKTVNKYNDLLFISSTPLIYLLVGAEVGIKEKKRRVES